MLIAVAASAVVTAASPLNQANSSNDTGPMGGAALAESNDPDSAVGIGGEVTAEDLLQPQAPVLAQTQRGQLHGLPEMIQATNAAHEAARDAHDAQAARTARHAQAVNAAKEAQAPRAAKNAQAVRAGKHAQPERDTRKAQLMCAAREAQAAPAGKPAQAVRAGNQAQARVARQVQPARAIQLPIAAQTARAASQVGSVPAQAQPGPLGWVAPTVGRLTSGYGPRGGTMHWGIDIANKIGTPIVAAADGVVVESGPASGFGLWVRIRHADGTITVYGHIDRSLVRAGQHVRVGQQIATMGNRGQATGPHLHFEVWNPSGAKINPLTWLRSKGVRI